MLLLCVAAIIFRNGFHIWLWSGVVAVQQCAEDAVLLHNLPLIKYILYKKPKGQFYWMILFIFSSSGGAEPHNGAWNF